MKTLVFGLHLSEEEKEVISSLQRDYSISFRKMYNNMELMQDKEFLKSLRIKSKKQIEYLQIEVLNFHDNDLSNKKRIEENIKELEEKSKLSLKEYRKIQRLKISLNNKVVFGGRKELIKLSKGIGNKDKWKESRLLPLVYYGCSARYGNDYFNLRDISKGNILMKKICCGKPIPIKINIKRHKGELVKLEELILRKEIPVTIRLNKDKLCISYDESKLTGTYLDIKSFYKEIKHVTDKEERKY